MTGGLPAVQKASPSSGLFDPRLLEISPLTPTVVSSQLIGHHQTFQCQDGPVTLPGPMALEGLDVMCKQENYQVLQGFFIGHVGIFRVAESGHPVVPVIPCSFVQ